MRLKEFGRWFIQRTITLYKYTMIGYKKEAL
jgi:hypothetical protein